MNTVTSSGTGGTQGLPQKSTFSPKTSVGKGSTFTASTHPSNKIYKNLELPKPPPKPNFLLKANSTGSIQTKETPSAPKQDAWASLSKGKKAVDDLESFLTDLEQGNLQTTPDPTAEIPQASQMEKQEKTKETTTSVFQQTYPSAKAPGSQHTVMKKTPDQLAAGFKDRKTFKALVKEFNAAMKDPSVSAADKWETCQNFKIALGREESSQTFKSGLLKLYTTYIARNSIEKWSAQLPKQLIHMSSADLHKKAEEMKADTKTVSDKYLSSIEKNPLQKQEIITRESFAFKLNEMALKVGREWKPAHFVSPARVKDMASGLTALNNTVIDSLQTNSKAITDSLVKQNPALQKHPLVQKLSQNKPITLKDVQDATRGNMKFARAMHNAFASFQGQDAFAGFLILDAISQHDMESASRHFRDYGEDIISGDINISGKASAPAKELCLFLRSWESKELPSVVHMLRTGHAIGNGAIGHQKEDIVFYLNQFENHPKDCFREISSLRRQNPDGFPLVFNGLSDTIAFAYIEKNLKNIDQFPPEKLKAYFTHLEKNQETDKSQSLQVDLATKLTARQKKGDNIDSHFESFTYTPARGALFGR